MAPRTIPGFLQTTVRPLSIPPHASRNADVQAELMDLRQKLRDAVEIEAYEEAARLRDKIRQKEGQG